MLLLMQLSDTIQQINEASKCSSPIDAQEMAHYLHAAIISGDLAAISQLLEKGHDPNTVYNGFTPLTLCLSFHKNISQTVSVTKLLIKYGANVNLCMRKSAPLHIACLKGLTRIAEAFANPCARCFARRPSLAFSRPLLNHRAVPSIIGGTAQWCSKDILLENGATTEALSSSDGLTALQFTLKLLINSKTQKSIDMYTNVVFALLRYPLLDVTNCGVYGPSPLHLSVLTTQPSIILAVIEKGSSRLHLHDIRRAIQLTDSCSIFSDGNRQEIICALRKLDSSDCLSLEGMTRTVALHRPCAVEQLPCPTTIKRFMYVDDSVDDSVGDSVDDSVGDSVEQLKTVEQINTFLSLF